MTKSLNKRLTSILLATMMVLSMCSAMFAVSAEGIEDEASALAAVEAGVLTVEIDTIKDADEGEALAVSAIEKAAAEIAGELYKVTFTATSYTAPTDSETAGEIEGKFTVHDSEAVGEDADAISASDKTITVTLKADEEEDPSDDPSTTDPTKKVTASINYADETIEITAAAGATYMYAVKAADDTKVDSKDLAKDKWFPISGTIKEGKLVIDISKYIPKRDTPAKPYYIAVRNGDDTFRTSTTAGGYASRTALKIVGRPEAKTDIGSGKTIKVTYDAATGVIKNTVDKNVEIQIGISPWEKLTATTGIKTLKAEYLPTGSPMNIRVAATGTSFASATVKSKLIAQPKAPSVKVSEKTDSTTKAKYNILNSKDTYEVYGKKITAGAPEATESWVKIGANQRLDELNKIIDVTELTKGQTTIADDSYILLVRVGADSTAGKPYSAVTSLTILQSKFNAGTSATLEAAKITAALLGTIKVNDNVLTKAQTLVSEGYTVTIKTSATATVINATGTALIEGSSNVTFTVTNKTTASDKKDTTAISIPVVAADAPSTNNFITGVTISGTAQVGETLTATPTVTGTPSPAVTYQWQICETEEGTYENITGATSATYTPIEGDATKFIKVIATQTGAPNSPFTYAATTAVAAATGD